MPSRLDRGLPAPLPHRLGRGPATRHLCTLRLQVVGNLVLKTGDGEKSP